MRITLSQMKVEAASISQAKFIDGETGEEEFYERILVCLGAPQYIALVGNGKARAISCIRRIDKEITKENTTYFFERAKSFSEHPAPRCFRLIVGKICC